jgi:hypothetical protein
MAEQAPPTSPSREDQNRELISEAVSGIPLIGKLLAIVVRQGRWRVVLAVAMVFLVFVVYPLLVPLLASTWIRLGILRGHQEAYAEQVRSALRIEESATSVARRGNERLDYFQVIELHDRDVQQPPSYTLTAQPGQRVKIRKEEAVLRAVEGGAQPCAIPRELLGSQADLFTLRAHDVTLMQIRNGPPQSVEITPEQWQAMMPTLEPGRLVLSLAPVKELRAVECSLKADITLAVEVYKDSVSAVAAKAGGI